MPPHLKKSIIIIQANLEMGTYEQIVSHFERELELNGLEAPDEMQMNTVTQQASKPISEKLKPTCHLCKKPGHKGNQCRQIKKEREQNDIKKVVPVTIIATLRVAIQNPTPTTKPSVMAMSTVQTTVMIGNQ